jgi:cell division protein FtsZ
MSEAPTSRPRDLKPRIVVIGVGGGGGNAVNNMITAGLVGPRFVVANTDAQALSASSAEHRIQLGVRLTEGIGAGARHEVGEAAAEESLEEIRTVLQGAHMVFIAAGMGGGTGTGAAPVIARVAKELGILTVAVVTKPFLFEGKRRMRTAEAGIAELARHVDTLIVIPNQNLFKIADERTPFAEAFVLADQVLYSGVACIVDLVVREALINLDLADVRTVLNGMGTAMMGTGEAAGEDRAIAAARDAIFNPLLDDISLSGAKNLLLSISGGQDLTLFEVHDAVDCVRQELDPEANIIFGATLDDALTGRIRVSIVASGMHRSEPAPAQPPAAAAHAHGARRGAIGSEEARRRSEPIAGRREPEFGPAAVDAPQREVWRGPGDVVIRERPPQLSGHLSHGGRSARDEEGTGRSEKQRSYGGRGRRAMPTVEDFPPVAQREYWAKVGDGRREQPQDAPPPAKKPSLLQRLRGGGRDRRADVQPVSGRPAEEPLDLPVFFRRDRRS